MWSIRTRKYLSATPFKRSCSSIQQQVTRQKRLSILRRQKGQAVLEYLLIVLVILGIFITIARPGFEKLTENIQATLKSGFFAEDDDGSGFYYYPLK